VRGASFNQRQVEVKLLSDILSWSVDFSLALHFDFFVSGVSRGRKHSGADRGQTFSFINKVCLQSVVLMLELRIV
jgi:hypothetical protein